jgi:hypothetical protein
MQKTAGFNPPQGRRESKDFRAGARPTTSEPEVRRKGFRRGQAYDNEECLALRHLDPEEQTKVRASSSRRSPDTAPVLLPGCGASSRFRIRIRAKKLPPGTPQSPEGANGLFQPIELLQNGIKSSFGVTFRPFRTYLIWSNSNSRIWSSSKKSSAVRL